MKLTKTVSCLASRSYGHINLSIRVQRHIQDFMINGNVVNYQYNQQASYKSLETTEIPRSMLTVLALTIYYIRLFCSYFFPGSLRPRKLIKTQKFQGWRFSSVVRLPGAPEKNQDLILSIHIAVPNHSQHQFLGIKILF